MWAEVSVAIHNLKNVESHAIISIQDPQLYNRVGATLANSGQASYALENYYKVLELNPAYITARSVYSGYLRIGQCSLFYGTQIEPWHVMHQLTRKKKRPFYKALTLTVLQCYQGASSLG